MLIDSNITNEALTEIYQGFFFTLPCLTCPGGREEAINRVNIEIMARQQQPKQYRFKDEFKDYTISVKGVASGINATNLTTELANKLIEVGLGEFIEEVSNGSENKD